MILSDTELAQLQTDLPTKWQHYIDRLSEYMASTGKKYQSHLATIRRWAADDGNRYLSRQPFIITTNLTVNDLKEPKDIAYAHIYDRILERCAPVLFGGKNYRKENAESTKQAIRQIIAEQEESL